MKLPIVQADVNVNADYPHRGIPAAAFQSGLGAAGKEIAQGAEDIGRIYQKKQHENDQAEAIFLQSQAELALNQSDAARKLTETDGNTYLEGRRKDFQEVMEQVAGQAKNPGAARLLRNHMAGVLVQRDKEALSHASDLIQKSEVAQLGTTIDNLNTMISTTDWREDKLISRYDALKQAAIDLRAPTIGVDAAQKMKRIERQRSGFEVALRHKEEDPVDFLGTSRRYEGVVDGERLDRLREGARTAITQAEDRATRLAEKRDKQFQAAVKADQEALVTEFSRRVREVKSEEDRAGIIRDLNMRQELRQIGQVDYDRIYKETTDPKLTPSDPATLSRVGLDAENLYPKVTPAEVDRLHQRYRDGLPGLSYPDAEKIKQQLRTTAKSHIDEAKSDRVKEHNQAEQELRAYLGIRPGMIEKLTDNINTNDPIARLYAQGLAQLRTRSYAFDGKEAPLAVIAELGPRLQRTAGVTKEMQAQTLQQTLLVPTRQELEAQYKAGSISKPQYLYELRQFDQLDRIVPPRPAGAAPSPAPAQPGKIRERIK